MPMFAVKEISEDWLEDVQWQISKRPASTRISLPLNHHQRKAHILQVKKFGNKVKLGLVFAYASQGLGL